MKAMILAAGLGTRLRPITDTRPKALVEINGRTLLEITLTRLRSFGVNEVIINVHHFAGMVVDYLKSQNNFGMRIEISREDDLLLDTGGGLKKAAWFFLEHSQQTAKKNPSTVIPSAARNRGKASTQSNSNQKPDASGNDDEPFVLHNVDVISTIDLRRMLQFHNERRALATLAVQSRESSRLLFFNDQLQLSGRAAPPNSPAAAHAPHPVIPSEARNPGRAPSEPNTDQTRSASPAVIPSEGDERPTRSASPESYREESAFSSDSPLVTRHSPLPEPLAFSGIHVISPRLFPLLTEEGVFPIIDAYLRLAAQGEKILAFRADEYYWRDLGRPAGRSQAARDLQQRVIE